MAEQVHDPPLECRQKMTEGQILELLPPSGDVRTCSPQKSCKFDEHCKGIGSAEGYCIHHFCDLFRRGIINCSPKTGLRFVDASADTRDPRQSQTVSQAQTRSAIDGSPTSQRSIGRTPADSSHQPAVDRPSSYAPSVAARQTGMPEGSVSRQAQNGSPALRLCVDEEPFCSNNTQRFQETRERNYAASDDDNIATQIRGLRISDAGPSASAFSPQVPPTNERDADTTEPKQIDGRGNIYVLPGHYDSIQEVIQTNNTRSFAQIRDLNFGGNDEQPVDVGLSGGDTFVKEPVPNSSESAYSPPVPPTNERDADTTEPRQRDGLGNISGHCDSVEQVIQTNNTSSFAQIREQAAHVGLSGGIPSSNSRNHKLGRN